jgi:hypothetical protein
VQWAARQCRDLAQRLDIGLAELNDAEARPPPDTVPHVGYGWELLQLDQPIPPVSSFGPSPIEREPVGPVM